MTGRTRWRWLRAAIAPLGSQPSETSSPSATSHGQCDARGWHNIVAVAAGSTHTLGLCADGTVVSAGNNAVGQTDVDSWSGVQVVL